MSLRRAFTQTLALAAALAFAGQNVLAQNPFPKSAMQPSSYTGRPAIGAATLPPVQVGGSQMISSPRSAGSTMRVDLSGPEAPSRMMSLPKGKSAVIELPVDARDVLVSDPKVADVVLSTPRRIYVLGVGAGQTDAVFFDGAGRQLLNLNIRVDQDISALSETLTRILPGSDIKVEGLNGSLILSGTVANLAEADKAVQLAKSTVAKPEDVINMLGIAEPEQVMLKVRIVEVNRTVIKQLGVNLNAVFNELGQPQLTLGNAATFGVNGALLGGLTGGYKYDSTSVPTLVVPCQTGVTGTCLGVIRSPTDAANYQTATITPNTVGKPGLNSGNAQLQAFESVGLVRTLAEPNLTAISGEAAKFQAGGEFPVPTGRDNNGLVRSKSVV